LHEGPVTANVPAVSWPRTKTWVTVDWGRLLASVGSFGRQSEEVEKRRTWEIRGKRGRGYAGEELSVITMVSRAHSIQLIIISQLERIS
jgi:hypothetical protein